MHFSVQQSRAGHKSHWDTLRDAQCAHLSERWISVWATWNLQHIANAGQLAQHTKAQPSSVVQSAVTVFQKAFSCYLAEWQSNNPSPILSLLNVCHPCISLAGREDRRMCTQKEGVTRQHPFLVLPRLYHFMSLSAGENGGRVAIPLCWVLIVMYGGQQQVCLKLLFFRQVSHVLMLAKLSFRALPYN